MRKKPSIKIATIISMMIAFFSVFSVYSAGDEKTSDNHGFLPTREKLIDTLKENDEKAQKLKLEIELGKNVDKGSLKARAQKVADTFYSDDYQGKIKSEQDRLTEALEPFYQDYKGLIKEAQEKIPPSRLAPDERVYLLISSSIPMHILRSYVEQLENANDPRASMYLRGFIGGATYVKPTVQFVMDLINKDDTCQIGLDRDCETFNNVNIYIDPMVFRRFDVNTAPAVVFAQGVSRIGGYETSEGIEEDFNIGKFYIVYGDMGLDYMLEKINSEAKSNTLEGFIASLRGGFYNEETASN